MRDRLEIFTLTVMVAFIVALALMVSHVKEFHSDVAFEEQLNRVVGGDE